MPAIVAAFAVLERRRRRQSADFASPALVPAVVDRSPGRRRFVPLAVLLVGLVAMVVGVARPHATITVPREEATVMIAIDTSRSMKASDVKPTRLAAALDAANKFVAKLPTKYRVGIVSFASNARVALPPTANRDLVTAALADLHPGEGTAIGDAVALSVRIAKGQRDLGRQGPADRRAHVLGRCARRRPDDPAGRGTPGEGGAHPRLHRRPRHAERRRPADAHRRVPCDDPRAAQPADAAADRRGSGGQSFSVASHRS